MTCTVIQPAKKPVRAQGSFLNSGQLGVTLENKSQLKETSYSNHLIYRRTIGLNITHQTLTKDVNGFEV